LLQKKREVISPLSMRQIPLLRLSYLALSCSLFVCVRARERTIGSLKIALPNTTMIDY
jgi:hypothetical protein